MSSLKDLHAQREAIDKEISTRVRVFLVLLDAAGEHAPTVTKYGTHGPDYEDGQIEIDGDRLIFPFCYRNGDHDSEVYPVAVVDGATAESVAAYVKGLRDAREERKAREERAAEAKNREQEIETLRRLAARYPNELASSPTPASEPDAPAGKGAGDE